MAVTLTAVRGTDISRHHGGTIEGLPRITRTSQQYLNEGFKGGGPQLVSHYAERCQPLGPPMWDFPNYRRRPTGLCDWRIWPCIHTKYIISFSYILLDITKYLYYLNMFHYGMSKLSFQLHKYYSIHLYQRLSVCMKYYLNISYV